MLNEGEESIMEIVFGQEVDVGEKAAKRIAKFLAGDNPDPHEAFKVVLRAAGRESTANAPSDNGCDRKIKKSSKPPATCRRQSRPAFGRFHA